MKNKYEVSDVDSIFDTVDEKEYSKKVYERQTDDWIVDDGKYFVINIDINIFLIDISYLLFY